MTEIDKILLTRPLHVRSGVMRAIGTHYAVLPRPLFDDLLPVQYVVSLHYTAVQSH